MMRKPVYTPGSDFQSHVFLNNLLSECMMRKPVYAPGSDFQSHVFLNNLLPLFRMPVPTRPAERRDFVSGLHRKSFSMENKVESAGLISLSFILPHDITLRLWISFHERSADSRPSVVSSEQLSRQRDFTLLLKITPKRSCDTQNPT